MPAKNKLYNLVTYAATLPFVACAVMHYTGVTTLHGLGSVSHMAVGYALIIISFIAGLHLGAYLLYQTKTPRALFLVSNIIMASAWVTVVATDIQIAVNILIFAFFYLLAVDYLLRREFFISCSYFRTRCIVTLIMTGSLFFSSGVS